MSLDRGVCDKSAPGAEPCTSESAARPESPTVDEQREFILRFGFRASSHAISAITGMPLSDVNALRKTGALTPLPKVNSFEQLFTLWHGRPPEDNDWPAPRRIRAGEYEWQRPEETLLAGLVGRMGSRDIAELLTARLRERTGDPSAWRSLNSVNVRTQRIGLQSLDVVGGITVTAAGTEIGSITLVQNAIERGQLRTIRVGRLHVIPHKQWAEWKSTRSTAPDGYVRLSSIREALAIRSDAKLPEFAKMGYIPTAVRCKPYGIPGPSTVNGTWYITEAVAEQLVADRRAGKPMPWHGKPMNDNLKATYKIWSERRHPVGCATCADIWGKTGAPESFEDYKLRYPVLAFGAKRHLTMQWSYGVSVSELAEETGRSVAHVKRAVANGVLKATLVGRVNYVNRTDATRWKERHCPNGVNEQSWISFDTACTRYLFTKKELTDLIDSGQLGSKIGTDGTSRGVHYVGRHQCGQLREKIGFTPEQAARRAGVTVERLHALLEGVEWRTAAGIPLAALQTVIKRLDSQEGFSLEEAACLVKMPLAWVKARRDDGTIKVLQAKWDRRRTYITYPTLERLREAKNEAPRELAPGDDWLSSGPAALEAGVSVTTLNHWRDANELKCRQYPSCVRYHRASIRDHARLYWETARCTRGKLPAWLKAERAARAAKVSENAEAVA